MVNAWCTAADVLTYTGKTVTTQDVTTAQIMVEALVKRVWRDTDQDTSSYYWLNRAVAFQAAFVSDNAEMIYAGNVASLSQDGFSISFDYSSIPMTAKIYSSTTLQLLNNIFRGANTTIRMNSAFQGSNTSRYRWKNIGW